MVWATNHVSMSQAIMPGLDSERGIAVLNDHTVPQTINRGAIWSLKYHFPAVLLSNNGGRNTGVMAKT